MPNLVPLQRANGSELSRPVARADHTRSKTRWQAQPNLQTAFAIQEPLYIVEEYIKMIEAFGLDEHRVYDRVAVQMVRCNDSVELLFADNTIHTERREQEPIAG